MAMRHFFLLVGHFSSTSFVLFILKFPDSSIAKKKDKRTFLYKFGFELVMPQIFMRKNSKDYKYFHEDVKIHIDRVIDTHSKNFVPSENTLITLSSQTSSIPISQSQYTLSSDITAKSDARPRNSNIYRLMTLVLPPQCVDIPQISLDTTIVVAPQSSSESPATNKSKKDRCIFCPRAKLRKLGQVVLSVINMCTAYSKQLIVCIHYQEHISFI